MPTNRLSLPIWLVIVIAVAALGVAVLGWAVGRAGHDTPHAPDAPDSAAAAAQEYTCSMHPQFRSDNPNDRCPYCGMALIPVPTQDGDEDDADLPRLRVSRRSAALMRIETRPAERRDVDVVVPVFGRIDYDESRLREATAWVPGRLDRLHVNVTGVRVEANQPLADIYSPELLTAQEELFQALRLARSADGVGAGVARVALAAARDKLRLWGFSDEQIRQIESAGRVREHLTITSPMAGTVIRRHVTQGEYVQTGQALYMLADLSRVWVVLEVYESDLPWLAVGQAVRFMTESHPGEEFAGVVSFIEPTVNEPTRTVRVRVEAANPDGLLKPGMFARGQVRSSVRGRPADTQPDEHADHAHDGHAATRPDEHADHDAELPLVIPASAPLLTGQRAVVYVQLPETELPTFEARQVLLGPRAGDYYVVREGLVEGEFVVVNGQFKIDSELQIRGRPSMMAPEGGPPPVHHHGNGTHESPGRAHIEPLAAPADLRAGIAETLKANFALVAALAGDDPAQARKVAAAAGADIAAIDDADWSRQVRDAWQSSARRMGDALAALADAGELPAQRRHFETFSDELTATVRRFGTELAVYRAMCPMVQGRRGYWLTDKPEIANPYHGAAMLRCGQIVERIAGQDKDAQPEEHRH